ncbi:MAG: hypothetical protein AAAFM81_03060 [Pseudomonadota bacterium]
MKLRLLGDSIRLRLTRSEVARIGAGQSVVETTHFSDGGQFEFALCEGQVDRVEARFDSGRLTVMANAELLKTWAATDRVALVEKDSTVTPQILVEKDFNCLVPRDGNDDADTFTHPEEGHRTC